MTYKLEDIRKEAIVANFKVLSHNSIGGTEENHENLRSLGRLSVHERLQTAKSVNFIQTWYRDILKYLSRPFTFEQYWSGLIP
jgi:hypothetical protein